jgi:superfamily II DNA or RNA helicase
MVQTYAWIIHHLGDFDTHDFDYVAIDEAHHAVAPALRKVVHRFAPRFLLGLTATDQRLDAQRLEDVFGKYDVKLTLVDAIRSGLLAPIRAFRLKSNIDLSEVRFNGRDYVNSDLERGVSVPSRNNLILEVLRKYFVDSSLDRKSGLIFCVSIKHAKQMALAMQIAGMSADWVAGVDRASADKVQQYQSGKIQFLTTCSLLNEGWDSPRTAVIVMARPTMSKVLYTQQLGRGTRTHPGKEALYVIDVVDS